MFACSVRYYAPYGARVTANARRAKTQHHVMVQFNQKPACAASRSARLPRASHLLTSSSPSDRTPSCSPGRPQPPPPGVSILSRSPLPIRIVAFEPMLISRVFGKPSAGASPSSSRLCLTQVLRPRPPCMPPSRPYGARVRRYVDVDGWVRLSDANRNKVRYLG